MSSVAFPRARARRRATGRALPAVFSRRGSDVLLAVGVVALAAVLLVSLPSAFNVDSWLALVAGRDIWQNGLPQHETLTVIAHGVSWVDQQWLSQLASYAIYRLGGLGLLGGVNVALIAISVAGSIAGARRLGAHPRAVMLILPLAVMLIVPSREVRTQEFAMPLFVAMAYLLASDSRAPTRRVYWCLPILVLWANLHGTVTLGAMLVALRGVTVAWERRHSLIRSLREWGRPLALMLGAPICLLLTPYGLSIVGYYRTTMLGSTLRNAVSEWQPITSSPITAAAFFIAAGIALWSFGRYASRTTLWERLALLLLAAGSISVIRNVLFFGLFALMIVPLSLAIQARAEEQPARSEERPARAPQRLADRRRGRVNALLCVLAVGTLVVGGAATLLRPAASIELHYQRTQVLNVVERTTRADPSIRVFTDDRFSDWLLWRDPALSGRIANDVRFELLTAAQINQVQRVFSVLGTNWKQGARGYRLMVLDKDYEGGAVQAFLHEPGHRVLYNDGERIVILRAASQAG